MPDLRVTLAEIDGGLCALAAHNAEANGLAARVRALAVDVEDQAGLAAAGLPAGAADRVLMNPPFNDSATQRASPDHRRRLAHAAPREALSAWIRTAARLLRPRGTMTVILRADGLANLLKCLDGTFGAVAILPVYARSDQSAIRVLVRATKMSRGPLAQQPGLILNNAAGEATAEAESILRKGALLPLAKV
jgi:tRNA1(Val) A37 N6-methylase TrmN6